MTSRELCRRLKVTRRMLQWWRDHRLVKANWIEGRGSAGVILDYDDEQALQIAVMAELRRKGMSLDQIRKLKLKPARMTGDFLVTDLKQAIYCTEAEVIPLVCEFSNGCFVVSLNDLRARLTAPLRKVRKAVA